VEDLTHRQRLVFVASVLNGVPLEALAAELGPPQTRSTRPCSMRGLSCGSSWRYSGPDDDISRR